MKIDASVLFEPNEQKTIHTGYEKKGVLTENDAIRRTSSESFSLHDSVLFPGQEQTYTKQQGRQDIMDSAQAEEKPVGADFEYLVNTMTSSDYEETMEDGFSAQKDDVKKIVTEMDKIKIQLAKAGEDISYFGDGVDVDAIAQEYGGQAMAQVVEQALKEANLPSNEENIKALENVAAQSGELKDLSDGAIRYLIENNLPPTVENIYQAQFSGGYFTVPEDVALPEGLDKAVANLLERSGLENNAANRKSAAWLLHGGMELTAENITYQQELQELKLPADTAEVLSAGLDAMQEGKRPQEAMLLEGYTYKERAEQAAETIRQADENTVAVLVEAGKDVTIENLEWALGQQEKQAADGETEGEVIVSVSPEKTGELLKKTRQLEEIRLMMTVQANYSLLKKGIQIETQPLEQLVEQLKEEEMAYYRQMTADQNVAQTRSQGTSGQVQTVSVSGQVQGASGQAQGAAGMDAAQLMYETSKTTAGLKEAPADILAEEDITQKPLSEVQESAAARKRAYEEANRGYEPLMTAPRRDMGDKIEDAFRNIEDILKDMNLPTTEENMRAVRILGYNSMEITQENIQTIKAADVKVQRMFANLTPSVVLEMIREGKNPLQMSVDELNDAAVQIKEKQEEDTSEKYSKFLWKLEQTNGITKEERSAYIGIYRLLHQIENTNGAAVGALVQQNAQLSMKNLLSSVRTFKHGGMDIGVDDSVGQVESLTADAKSISAQIEAGFQTECAKAAYEQLTPEHMTDIMQENAYEQMTPEEFLAGLRSAGQNSEQAKQASASGQAQQASGQPAAAGSQAAQETARPATEQEYAQMQLEEMQSMKGEETEILQQLEKYEMPKTLYNMLGVSQMHTRRNQIFRQLFSEEAMSGQPDLKAACKELLDRFGEAMQTPEELAKAQEELAQTAEHVMKSLLEEEETSSIDIRNMKIACASVTLSVKMVKEEHYHIPVMIGSEVTNVSLKIVRGTKEKGKVNIAFETEAQGKVAVQVKVDAKGASAMAAVSHADSVQWLKERQEQLTDAMNGILHQENGSVQIVESAALDINHFLESVQEQSVYDAEHMTEELDQVQTRVLYGIAKEFIAIFKS